MERTHGELRPGLTDRLSSHDTDGFPDDNRLTFRKVQTIALGTDTVARITGKDRADMNTFDPCVFDCFSNFGGDECIVRSDDLTCFRMEDVLSEERDYAKQLACEMREDIRAKYFDPDTARFAGDCQSSQAFGIYAGLCDSSEVGRAFEYLLKLIEEQNHHMDVGIYGGRVLFHVLAQYGESDLALTMIRQPDYPSYGNLLERGATSLWEMFLPEGQLSGSENHHFWGDISHWFLRYLCGINVNPQQDDPEFIKISPHFNVDLTEVEGSYKTPQGEIHVRWKKTDDICELVVTTKGEAHGMMDIPEDFASTEGLDLSLGKNTSKSIELALK